MSNKNYSQSKVDRKMVVFESGRAKVEISAASPEMADNFKKSFEQSEEKSELLVKDVERYGQSSAHQTEADDVNQDGDHCSVVDDELDAQDSRHSWLLLANLFIFNAIQGFHFMCFGMYYVAWSDAFDTTKAAVGLINGFQYISRSVSSMMLSTLMLHVTEIA